MRAGTCAALAAVALAGCTDGRDGFDGVEWSLIGKMHRTEPEPPPPGFVQFGATLFSDSGYATHNGEPTSCATCHDSNHLFLVAPSLGTTVDSPSLLDDSQSYTAFGSTSRATSQAGFIGTILLDPSVFGSCGPGFAEHARDKYLPQLQCLFPDLVPSDDLAVVRACAIALSAFLSTQQSRLAPIDCYSRGDLPALSAQQKRGLSVFIGRGDCVGCHSGSWFTDSAVHNIGTAGSPEDLGHALTASWIGHDNCGVCAPATSTDDCTHYDPFDASPPTSSSPADLGAFRTRSLRNVALTAPYFHDRGATTLAEVVQHYDWAAGQFFRGNLDPMFVPVSLSDQQQADLLAFLDALTAYTSDADIPASCPR